MKLRDTNEPRQRTNWANGDHERTDGRTNERTDGQTDGWTDSPTFRTNWSHEILGEPKKDRAALLRKEDGEVQATWRTARERTGVQVVKGRREGVRENT